MSLNHESLQTISLFSFLDRISLNSFLIVTEATTDRHNMTLFLYNDSMQKYPAGFQNPRLNFFDPSEDIQRAYEKLEREVEEAENEADDESVESQLENERKRTKHSHDVHMTSDLSDDCKTALVNKTHDLRDDSDDENDSEEQSSSMCTHSELEISSKSSNSPDLENEMEDDSNRGELFMSDNTKDPQCHICIRPNCKKPSRFDSSFCSDACGVATLELDLLRSFEYSKEMHPYILRN